MSTTDMTQFDTPSNFPSQLSVAQDPNDEFTFVPVHLSRSAGKYKFAFKYINQIFTDNTTNSRYRIQDIVRLSTSVVSNIYCFQYYNVDLFPTTPENNSDFEYESIDDVIHDSNYTFQIPLPTKPNARVRRTCMITARRKINISDEPMSIAQAIAHPYADQFMRAFADEIQSLEDMASWKAYFGDVKDIPKGLLLSSKVVFSIVYNPDGTFKKFKARLVARGDQLKTIFDPDTYAGTAHSDTLRLFLSVAATLDYDIDSHDVKTAFLHPSLKPDEKIYLRRPKGATDEDMPPVVELLKCIYGLPQAAKYFDEHVTSRLLGIGFRRCVFDSQLFILDKTCR